MKIEIYHLEVDPSIHSHFPAKGTTAIDLLQSQSRLEGWDPLTVVLLKYNKYNTQIQCSPRNMNKYVLWFGDANTMVAARAIVHQNQTLLPRFRLKMWPDLS